MGQELQDPAMRRLAPFVGEWSVEAAFPNADFGDLRGRTVFEWILGGRYLLERSEVPHPDAPDGMSVIAPDPATGDYLQHYFDDRGVVRLYRMTFADGVWTLLRDAPDFSPLPFRQRFTGTFSEDGTAIDGRWEKSADGSSWELDFGLAYAKVA